MGHLETQEDEFSTAQVKLSEKGAKWGSMLMRCRPSLATLADACDNADEFHRRM